MAMGKDGYDEVAYAVNYKTEEVDASGGYNSEYGKFEQGGVCPNISYRRTQVFHPNGGIFVNEVHGKRSGGQIVDYFAVKAQCGKESEQCN